MNIGDKACFLTRHPGNGSLLWLVGMVKQSPAPGVYVCKIRKDYLAIVEPHDHCLVAEPWVFPDWTSAAKLLEDADQLLSKAIIGYDGNWDWDKERAELNGVPPTRGAVSSAGGETPRLGLVP